MLYQLFGVGAIAHRGLLPVRGFVREVPLAFPAPHHSAREGCPGHCGTLAEAALRHGVEWHKGFRHSENADLAVAAAAGSAGDIWQMRPRVLTLNRALPCR